MNRRSFLARAGAAVAALVGVGAAASTPAPVMKGIDFAAGPDTTGLLLYGGARGGGKSELLRSVNMQRELDSVDAALREMWADPGVSIQPECIYLSEREVEELKRYWDSLPVPLQNQLYWRP